MQKKKLLFIFMIFITITIVTIGEVSAKKDDELKKGDTVYVLNDKTQLYYKGTPHVAKTVNKGKKLTVKKIYKDDGKLIVKDSNDREYEILASGVSKNEPGSTENTDDANNSFINDVYSFIDSQKDRNWEFIEASNLFGTYNTAYVNRKKIEGNQKKYGLDNNKYNDILNKLNDILNKSLKQIHKEGWKEDIRDDKIVWTNENTGDQVQTRFDNADNNEAEHPEDTSVEEYKQIYIFKQPEIVDSSTSSTDSIDGLITDSDKFINKGSNDRISDESIQDFSKTLYNILITIAIVVSVIIGGILGIKIMLASVEEKAQVKELLVPYIIGCVVVFGAFGIWKLVVNILQNI